MSKNNQSIPPAPQSQYPQQYPPQYQPQPQNQYPPSYYQQQPQYPQQQQTQGQGLWNPSGVYGGVPEPRKKGLRWWGWLLIVLAVIVVISAAVNQAKTSTTTTTNTSTNASTSSNSTTSTGQQQQQAAAAPKLARIGDTQSLNGYLITVNAIQKSDNFTQGDFGKAKPGNTMLAVDLTVGSSKDSGVNPNGLSCTLKDSQGFKYSIIAIGYKDPLLPGGNDLASGDKVRGWVTFEVPKSANGFVLEYSPLFESGSVRVSLGN